MGVLSKPIPFGPYYLLEKINTGGMAEIFKAKSFGVEGFERVLAVKKILPSIAEDEEFITMFIDEAKIAGKLSHSNIAQIFDLGCIEEQYYIALEYVPGKDLRAIYDRASKGAERPSIEALCYIFMKVCEGLEYAHNKTDAMGKSLGIVHRDISPQNIIIGYDGQCKLIDFGIAKAQGKSSATQVGVLKGKFSYMSPEQVRGATIDRRSDLFALGIVLYELLTLKRLFVGSTDFSTLEKIRKVEFSPPTVYNDDIPSGLEAIVLKALAKNPEERYQSAQEMHNALQRFMFEQDIYFSSKDLSSYCHRVFAGEIALEAKKTEFYQSLTKEVLENARQAQVSASGFYAAQNIPHSRSLAFEKAMPSPANGGKTKEDIYAELDDFNPAGQDIIYATPPPKSQTSMPAVMPPGASGAMPPHAAYAPSHRPAQRRTALLLTSIILVLLFILTILFIIYAVLNPQHNDITFKIVPEDVPVDIMIDGQLRADDQMGMIKIVNLSTKTPHNFVIQARDFKSQSGNFVLERKALYRSIQLEADVSGELSLALEPTEAKLFIDGEAIEGKSPHSLKGLEPGLHMLRAELNGYRTLSREFRIERTGEALDLNLKLEAITATLNLNTIPAGVAYTLVDPKSKQRYTGKTNDTITNLKAGINYEMTLGTGSKAHKSNWLAPQSGGSHSITITLSAPSTLADAQTPPKSPKSSKSSHHKSSSSRRPKKTKTTPPPPAPPVTSGPPGSLVANSKPPSTVIIDGKAYGTTPVVVKKLKPGKHKVRFVNSKAGIDKTKTVIVKPGEKAKVFHRN